MSARWPAYKALGVDSGLLAAIGFFGLWLCKMVQQHQAINERQFMETTMGGIAVWSLSAYFILGFALYVAAVILQKRAGVPFPRLLQRTVPGWSVWPVKAAIILIVCVMLWCLVGGFCQFVGR